MLSSRNLQSRRSKPASRLGATRMQDKAQGDENLKPGLAASDKEVVSPAAVSMKQYSHWESQWEADANKVATAKDLSPASIKERRAPFSVLTPRNNSSSNKYDRQTAASAPPRERSSKQRSAARRHSSLTPVSVNDDWAVVAVTGHATDDAIAKQLARFEATIVDKGYNAIKTIGQVAANWAESLDTAIEQLVGTLSVNEDGSVVSRPKVEEEVDIDELCSSAARDRPAECSAASLASAPSVAAAGIEQEQQRLRRLQREYLKLRDRYSKVQLELHERQAQLEKVEGENQRLKQQLVVMPEGDPLADQVAHQLQALLAEKAALASENAQLSRANAGLQELLEYSTAQQMAALEYHAEHHHHNSSSGGHVESIEYYGHSPLPGSSCGGGDDDDEEDGVSSAGSYEYGTPPLQQLPQYYEQEDDLDSCRSELAFEDKIED